MVNIISNFNHMHKKENFQKDFSSIVLNVLYNSFKAYAGINEENMFFDRINDSIDLIFCFYLLDQFENGDNQQELYEQLDKEKLNKKAVLDQIERNILQIGTSNTYSHSEPFNINFFDRTQAIINWSRKLLSFI